MVSSLGDSLDLALEKAFTRPAPKRAQAQMKYLVKQLKSTKAAAEALGVSQRTVERYVKGQLKRPPTSRTASPRPPPPTPSPPPGEMPESRS